MIYLFEWFYINFWEIEKPRLKSKEEMQECRRRDYKDHRGRIRWGDKHLQMQEYTMQQQLLAF